ncbi:cell division FtsZ-interacting protein ZapD [Nocardioides thalensis]|uniref:Cell division FtsZ-interacting protein ZapD n=1 Tax=Nocardioides thalensis TaxID=1914755 RepID=A0A853C4X7_9ACTN|nr:cell division FtsZ-interacting protein ZapD [Nocardioides thalensis]
MTASEWGRVGDDGTVYVKTADGERAVGQVPDVSPEEALSFYTKRYDALAVEVDLLHRRVTSGVLSPDEALSTIKTVRGSLPEANAVGDLPALCAKLDELLPVIAAQRENRRAEKAKRQDEARAQKEQLAAEAEKIAGGRDWKNGANRLRELLEQWKQLPRIDKAADDALWKRFSSARSAYTKARKAHFAEQDEKREAARIIKERLATEAEVLADSTDWGPTASRYRDLMRDWKAAGPAPKAVDDELWQRFRGAQDKFFGARDAANAALDAEFAANAEVKEAILVEAEALLPVTDLAAAKAAFRELADRWDEAGKVPRDRIKELEGRMRTVEQAIRKLEDEQWKKSDPEKSARADDMVSKLETAIADAEAKLEKARAAGDQRKIKELEENLEGRRSFLEMAKRASADFS